jgi:hypothetical protein
MIERGIMFKGHLVREILADRKTVTRRLNGLAEINRNPDGWRVVNSDPWSVEFAEVNPVGRHLTVRKPWREGDRLWVRETWAPTGDPAPNEAIYRADEKWSSSRWRPSIFMPRWASRITLEVVSVRVERLQEITLADIEAEGFGRVGALGQGATFERWAKGWDAINAKRGSWASNPWVWRIEFRRAKEFTRGYMNTPIPGKP